MEKWLLVVISWAIVLPILAFWASYVVVSGDEHRGTTPCRKGRRTSRQPRRTIRVQARRSQSMGSPFVSRVGRSAAHRAPWRYA